MGLIIKKENINEFIRICERKGLLCILLEKLRMIKGSQFIQKKQNSVVLT